MEFAWEPLVGCTINYARKRCEKERLTMHQYWCNLNATFAPLGGLTMQSFPGKRII